MYKEGYLPAWMHFVAFIGLPGFLLMFLLGAIPGLPSPYAKMGELIVEQQKTIQLRDKALRNLNEQILQTLRHTCVGIWRHDAKQAQVCYSQWQVPELRTGFRLQGDT